MTPIRPCLALGLILALAASTAYAEEGLWTLDQAARPDVAQRIGLKDDAGLLARLPSNIVRFPSGEAGTVVSTQGLVVTVRRVAVPCLNAASRAGVDRIKDGFQAVNTGDLRCPDLTLERTESITDVTKQIRQGLRGTDAIPVDRISSLEKECRQAGGFECRVITLFHGAVIKLERFQRHRDIRLVFAPEYRLAEMGNSNARMIFPRFSLGVAFLRIYEQGKPLSTPLPLRWNTTGPVKGDQILVASYPGETNRYLPWVFLEPLVSLGLRREYEIASKQAQALFTLSREEGETVVQEAARAGFDRLAGHLRSAMAVFQNRSIKRKQRAAESDWRTLITQPDPKVAESAWAAATAAKDHYKTLYRQYLVLEGDRGLPFGQLFDIGRQLVRWCGEKKKPEGERLPEYRGSGLVEIKQRLSEPLPISGPVEETLLEMGLQRLRDQLEAKNPLAQSLAAESPSDRASRIVATTKIGIEAVRKAILESGELGEATDDPLLVLVKAIESEAYPLRVRYEQEVVRSLSIYSRVVGQRVNAADSAGESQYPDANLDLRLSSGHVRGFLDSGRGVPFQTTLGGLITRGAWAPPGSPWKLPKLWRNKQRQVTLVKPINFVIDVDIGSGAAGGAVLNPSGAVLGIIIDSTLKSAVNRFLYRGGDERAVAVHPAGISEALQKVYGATGLADELARGKQP